DQPVEAVGPGRLALERAEEVARQPDRADADRRYAEQLLGPAGEVEPVLAVDLGKLGLPVTPLRAVQDVDPGLDQRSEPLFELLRGAGEPRGIVLLLPLADAQQDRIVGPDRCAGGGDDLGGKARSLADRRPAVAVGAAVGLRPEELVDQV